MFSVLKDRNFFIFWVGETISVIGDHISLLAFPWLVLQMTGSPALTGLVLAAQGIPRALLMLSAGAMVDRTSPRLIMMLSNLARLVLVMYMAYVITYQEIDIGTVFIVAILFGLADAFFYPASNAMLPSLVSKEQLQQGNALLQTTIHLGMTLGPVIAGLVIAGEISSASHQPLESNSQALSSFDSDREGLAKAFFVDGLTFAASLISLFFVKVRDLSADNEADANSLFDEIKRGLAWVWSIPAMRLGFIGMAILDFFFIPMIHVGLPVLANKRFVEGAYVYGLELAAYGVGALIGSIASGFIKGPRDKNLISTLYLVYAFSGSTLALVIFYEPYWWAMLLFFITGIFDSFVFVHFATWLQRTSPEAMIGRVMSILMLMSVGLLPIADAIMGLAIGWHLEVTMVGCSLIMVVLCGAVAMHPDARKTQPPMPA